MRDGLSRSHALVFNAITRTLPRDRFVSLPEREACTVAVLEALAADADQTRWRVRTTLPNGSVRVFDGLGLMTEQQANEHAATLANGSNGLRCEVLRCTDEVTATYPKEPK